MALRPGQRVDLITRCARLLANGRSWNEIDFILDQFGLPTSDRWDGSGGERPHEDYVRDMVSRADEVLIQDLVDYLSGDPGADPEAQPWSGEHGFRLFLSHLASEKAYAARLKVACARFGIDAFVAHEDIEPGREWLRTIIAALQSSHALAALFHSGFKDSNWCDQEVGIAIGRGIPALPVRVDHDPYGFLGAIQAVPATGLDASDVAWVITDKLLADKRTSATLVEALVERLVHALSFAHANTLARMLGQHLDLLTREHLDRLRAAQKANTEVEGAFDVPDFIDQLDTRLGPAPLSLPAYEDEEPF